MNKPITALFVSVLLAGCSMPFASASIALPGPQAWIDAPLDGSAFPLAPVELVAHGSDPSGLARLEFSIGGSVVAEEASPDQSGSMVHARSDWTPTARGTYTLQVRALNGAGTWSAPVSVTFTIEGAMTATPAAQAGPTPTPPATATELVGVSADPDAVFHSKACGPNDQNCASTCQPNAFTLRARVPDPRAVGSVVVFLRLSDGKTTTEWNEGLAMKSLGDGLYEVVIKAESLPDAGSFDEATVKYQFVATGADKSVVARSIVYADVALEVCP